MLYKVKLLREDVPVKDKKKTELMLNDLIATLPTLYKYKMDAEVKKTIRTLRDGRKKACYTLEVSRKFKSYDGLEPKTGEVVYNFPKIAKQLSEESKLPDMNKGTKVTPISYSSEFKEQVIVEQHPVSREIKVSSLLTKEEVDIDGKKKRVPVNKTQLLAELKKKIIDQIKDARKKNAVVYEQHQFKEGLKVPKLGEVYLEPGTFFKLVDKKIRYNMTKAKKPTEAKSKYIGIEIELAAKENREQLCDVLHAEGLGKYIQVHDDGSIGRASEGQTPMMKTYPYPHEISVLIKEQELEEVMTRLCNALNNKLNVKVDKTCGLHVHLDMRNRTVANSFSNLIAMQHFLYAMVPANRKTGSYSIPIQDRRFNPQGIDRNGHYDGVSQSAYLEHQTIEMRMHCGTTRANKIVNWIKFLIAIADAPVISYYPTSLRGCQSFFGFSDGLIEYCESRIAKFAKEHEKAKNHHTWMTKLEPVSVAEDNSSTEEESEVA